MGSRPSVEERIDRVCDAFYALVKELEPFKKMSRAERAGLIRALSPPDIGYLTSFLNAIYRDDDEFRTWLFSASYTPTGRRR